MTGFLQTMASFLALCAISALVARHTRLPAALAPLPVCCGAMVWLVVAGYCGVLLPAAVLLMAAGAASLVFLLASARRGGFRKLLSPGFVLFCAAGAAFILLFAVRKPMAQGWDEFSLWATAVKLTREHHVIYSAAPIGWPWVGTQKAGLPTFSYFFTLLGSYEVWRVYAAYAVLLCAVWAAVLGTLSWKHWKLAVPGAVVMFLLPYFTVYQRDIYCNFTYLSTYGDIPMGILCGGALAWYFHAATLRRQPADGALCRVPGLGLTQSFAPLKHLPAALRARLFAHSGEAGRIPLWPLALMTAAITLCKDTGLPLALIVAGVAFMDLLLCGGETKEQSPWRARIWLPKAGLFVLWAAGAGVLFLASGRYISSLGVAQGSVSTTGSGAQVSQGAMLIEGMKLLLGIAPGDIGAQFADKFAAIRDEMVSLFLPGELHQITIVGCGLFVMLFVWAVLALGALLCDNRMQRRSMALYGVLSTMGFFAYYIFIGFTYVFVFKGEGVAAMRDYNRYINTYYVMWVCGAFALLLLAAAQGSRWRSFVSWVAACGLGALGGVLLLSAGGASRRVLVAALVLLCAAGAAVALRKRLSGWQDCLTPAVLMLAALFLVRFTQLVQPQLSVIDYPDVVYNEARQIEQRAQAVRAQLAPDDTVYYVNSTDDGLGWFRYSYELLPQILAYSGGGGNFADVVRARGTEGADTAAHRSLEEFAAAVSLCDYLLLDETLPAFWEGYGDLFADGGAAFLSGETMLYRVELRETPQYEPVTRDDVIAPDGKEIDADGRIKDIGDGLPKAQKREKLLDAQTVLTLVPVEMEVPAA